MIEYCKKFKTLADLLADVDSPASARPLVSQMLRGLPKMYSTIVSVITHYNPVSSFRQARSMLLLKENRINSTKNSLSPVVLYASPNGPTFTQHSYSHKISTAKDQTVVLAIVIEVDIKDIVVAISHQSHVSLSQIGHMGSACPACLLPLTNFY